MFEAFIQGLGMVFEMNTFVALMIGVTCGLIIGIIPGLGGGIGLVLLLPFTFGMDSTPAFALLLGMYAVTMTGDTVTSVMLGIPGTSASQATILDGYPLAKQGQAQRALGAAFACSAFGGLFGALILAASLPLLKPLLRSFTNAELFMLGVLGISMVGALSGKSVFKGLAVATLGILIATIGYSQNGAVPRYFFGSDYLLDGAPLLPIVLGMFALPEMIDLAVRNISIARDNLVKDDGGRELMWEGVRDAFRNWWLVIRSAVIGTYVGIIPGLGGSVTDWIAYGHAVQSTKKDPKFGKGDIRGVIAPETANNAMRGGGLLPTIVFGIPGTTGYAISIGRNADPRIAPRSRHAHDRTTSVVQYGVDDHHRQLHCGGGVMMFVSNKVARLAFVPGHMIVPGVILFVMMGAWMDTSTYGDWVTLLIAGTLGYLMKRGGWPRPPVILAFILGAIMENSFLITMNIHEGFGWLTRPIVLIILAVVLLTLFGSMRRNKLAMAKIETQEAQRSLDEIPLISTGLGVFFLGVLSFAAVWSLQWSESVRLFPLAASSIGATLVLAALVQGRFRMRASGISHALQDNQREVLVGMLTFLAVLLAVVLGALIIGQKLALPLFIVLFCKVWAKFTWRFSFTYALGGWAILALFYERVLTIFWQPSLLGDAVSNIVGNDAPLIWLFF